MKKAIVTSLISLIIVVVGPDLYADGTKGKKETSSARDKKEKVVEMITNVIDSELNFESWMTELKAFNTAGELLEESLTLENWMKDVEAFETESGFAENEMVLENWMMEAFEIGFVEDELVLENWMLQPFGTEENFQDEELQLESWMYRF